VFFCFGCDWECKLCEGKHIAAKIESLAHGVVGILASRKSFDLHPFTYFIVSTIYPIRSCMWSRMLVRAKWKIGRGRVGLWCLWVEKEAFKALSDTLARAPWLCSLFCFCSRSNRSVSQQAKVIYTHIRFLWTTKFADFPLYWRCIMKVQCTF